MLDSVKRVKELRDLLAAAKQEREQTADALASLFTRSEQVDAVARSMKRAHDEAHTLSETLERLAGRVDTLDGRLSAVETIDARIAAVNASLGGVERTVQDLVGPDGHLPKYRALAQQVDSQEVQARASIEALKKDQLALDELRDQLRQAHVEVKDANDRASAVKADVEQVRVLGAQLAQDYGKIRDTSREAREHASATMETARDIEKKFASFAALEEMSKTAKERLAGLNLLAEHVTQKTKSLENQKQTLEHAIVESNRLNELVWNMDAQVAKLSESLKQVARTEETVEHLDKIARETAAHVEAATKSKEAFLEDVARIDRDHAALTDFIRSYDERLALERKELDSFDQRIVVVQAAIADVARNVDGVLAKDRALATMTQQIGALETQTGTLLAQVTDVHRRQADLESLRDRLDEVGGLAARTQDQFEYLTQMRTDLETLKGGIDEFYVSHEAAARLVDRLDADRVSLATFMERMDGFRVITPELDAKLDTVTSRLSIVDEGVHKASNLVALADELDRQMTRIANNQRFVDKVEQRVNALHATASDINGKLAEQLARRAEIDTLKSACDTVSVQVSDVQQKLESVSSVQQALSPLRTEIATLKTQIEHAYARFKETQRDEAEVAEQERRLKELLNANRDSSAEVAARLAQVRALTDALQRSTASKDELMEELARVQARQRDVVAQAAASDDQLKRLEAAFRQLEQRRSQLTFMERTVAGFETKLDALTELSEEVDRRIATVSGRAAIVDAVRKEVDAVHEVASTSRADLQRVTDQRAEVAVIRDQINRILATAASTRDQLADIEARRRDVEEIYGKANYVVNLLEDVQLNLELVNEQKAVVDHVAKDLAQLNSLVTTSQRTLSALQAERELAERIEKSIKSLRKRTGTSAEEGGKRSA